MENPPSPEPPPPVGGRIPPRPDIMAGSAAATAGSRAAVGQLAHHRGQFGVAGLIRRDHLALFVDPVAQRDQQGPLTGRGVGVGAGARGIAGRGVDHVARLVAPGGIGGRGVADQPRQLGIQRRRTRQPPRKLLGHITVGVRELPRGAQRLRRGRDPVRQRGQRLRRPRQSRRGIQRRRRKQRMTTTQRSSHPSHHQIQGHQPNLTAPHHHTHTPKRLFGRAAISSRRRGAAAAPEPPAVLPPGMTRQR